MNLWHFAGIRLKYCLSEKNIGTIPLWLPKKIFGAIVDQGGHPRVKNRKKNFNDIFRGNFMRKSIAQILEA
jgi:hypothetical protein